MRFKIDLASLIVGRKFTVFFTLYLRAISKYKPSGTGGGGDLTEGFLRNEFGGLIYGGAYFRNFTVFCLLLFASLMRGNTERR